MINVSMVSKSYGGERVLNEANLFLGDSQSIVLSGSSGCGKTTLLRCIAGLLDIDSGEIIIDGAVVSDRENYIKPHQRGIGFVFQFPTLWPHMTVKQNVMFGIDDYEKVKREERFEKSIKLTQVEDLLNKYPHQLSGGQQKRVALARAIAPFNKHIFLDEPLSNLDRKAKHELLDTLIKLIKEENKSLIYVSHSISETEEINGLVYEMVDGKIYKRER